MARNVQRHQRARSDRLVHPCVGQDRCAGSGKQIHDRDRNLLWQNPGGSRALSPLLLPAEVQRIEPQGTQAAIRTLVPWRYVIATSSAKLLRRQRLPTTTAVPSRLAIPRHRARAEVRPSNSNALVTGTFEHCAARRTVRALRVAFRAVRRQCPPMPLRRLAPINGLQSG